MDEENEMIERAYTWDAIRTIETDSISKVKFKVGSKDLKVSEVFNLLSNSEAFRGFFSESLTSNSFEAFFWEVPPITNDSFGNPFEYTQISAPILIGIEENPGPFSSQFASNQPSKIISFDNLGRDSFLIVPSPISKAKCYAHLALFLENAPADQVQLLWKSVADSIILRKSSSPIWLSTAGLGVSWIHLRLDSRPKYFRYQPYKSPDFSPNAPRAIR
jgi:hypothetical protein